jgi:hypothetical protein
MLLADTATLAPKLANSNAQAIPIPLEAPISQTLLLAQSTMGKLRGFIDFVALQLGPL